MHKRKLKTKLSMKELKLASLILAKNIFLKQGLSIRLKHTRSLRQTTKTLIRILSPPLRSENNKESPKATFSYMHDFRTTCNLRSQNLKR